MLGWDEIQAAASTASSLPTREKRAPDESGPTQSSGSVPEINLVPLWYPMQSSYLSRSSTALDTGESTDAPRHIDA